MRFSGLALKHGVETHRVGGVELKVYWFAKTSADLFKYRNKIGIDFALGALREARRKKRATMDEIALAAKGCRVTNVMRPFLESLH